MPRNNCVFSEKYSEEYPFLKPGTDRYSAFCVKCKTEFSIAGQGKGQIEQHVKSKKHKKNMQASAMSSKLSKFFSSKNMGSSEKILAAKEATFSYHTVKHRQSFKSMDCTGALVRQFFDPKFTCARTKCEAIVLNVLYPHVLSKIIDEVKDCKFITVFFDASNQRDIKMMPILVRYFHSKQGVCVKLIELKSLGGETAEQVASYIMATINQHNLQKKVIAISADNTNTNFGGSRRRGKKNVFRLLEESLKTKLIGIGCSAHIAHNAMKAAADILPVDVEIVIGKVYQYFKNYTVRVEKLKEFCDFLEIEYRRALGYSSTRWLALLPAIERMLQLFEALKSYFLSCEKPPMTLKNFFNDPSAELWMLFVQIQSHLFQTAVKRLEGEHVSVGSVAKTLDTLKSDLETRLRDKFLPSGVKALLGKLEKDGLARKKYVVSTACDFYSTAVEYIEEWAAHFNEFESYAWLELTQEIPPWNSMESSVLATTNRIKDHSGTDIDDSKLYTQISEVRRFVNVKLSEWTKTSAGISDRWIDVFHHLNETATPSDELATFAQYLLCLPGSNASVERVFSRIFGIWTDDKSKLSVQSLRAMISVDYNLNMKCKDFYQYISKESGLLTKVHATGKYEGEPCASRQSSVCDQMSPNQLEDPK